MKKNTCFFVVLLLSYVANSFSQEYHPFLNNSSWILYDWVSCCRPSEVKIIPEATDTIIGAYTYKKFDDPFPQNDTNFNPIYTVCLREDVVAKKVYKIVNGVDALLYDFSLENGDMISQYGNTFTATVDYIVVNDGTNRKRITLQSTETYCSQSLEQIWIEGIGSNKHPFYPENNMYNVCSAGGGESIYTRCSFQNGVHLFGNVDCIDVMESFLEVNQTEANSLKVQFSPNPFTTQLTIQSDVAFQNTTIRIYSAIGQLVYEKDNQSGTQLKINRSDLQRGFYLIQLSQKGKIITTTKIIAE